MSTDNWDRINDLFQAALKVDPSDRFQFVKNQCDDPIVLEEVNSLLAAYQEAGTFIETPVSMALGVDEEEGQAIEPGEMIGVYEILKEIGRGGMGAVYLAVRADHAFEKRVAIKLLKPGMDTSEVLRHFHNERQILADFDHPNIARLLDGGTTKSGTPYFVMEYVEGRPLDLYCNAQRLTITERLQLFQQICSAVSYAHRHLVIHRDIKPSNVLVTSDGVPKLLDFGIAKLLQQDDQARSTATGVRLMTPEYASPEQVFGHPVTTVSDVYSLGVLLYELVAGRLPYQFDSRSPIEIAHTLHDTQPLPPSTMVDKVYSSDKTEREIVSKARNMSVDQLKRRLRGDLDNIILMAIRKEPERRYQSVEQFSEDIHLHLVRRPVIARKDTIAYRLTKFARRNPISITVTAIAFLILFAGVITTTWQAQKAKAAQTRAEYASEFGDELRYIESLLLSTYTAPLHDARPTFKTVKDRLTRMEKRVIEGGESAYGPGHNALGNGYLILKDFGRAKDHLEKAWSFGYREPATAYALGKVLGIFYQQEVINADRVSSSKLKKELIRKAEAEYATRAIRLLTEARTFAESPAYVEGLIALYQKKFDLALQKTSEAVKHSSRPYEVMKLQGDIHFAMARDALAKNNQSSGFNSFILSGDSYSKAADSARSEPEIYLADAKRIIHMTSAKGEYVSEWVDEAILACDKAIRIDPDSYSPYIYKSEVYIQQGIDFMYHAGKDPRPAYVSAVKQADEAIRRNNSALSHDQASRGYIRMAEYELATNMDAYEALNNAISESNKAVQLDPYYTDAQANRATAYFLMSEYQLTRGDDPTASLNKVIEIYNNNLRSLPKDTYMCNLLGFAHLGLAEYKIKRGGDPREDLKNSMAHFNEGMKIDPDSVHMAEGLGLAYVDLAKYEMNVGIYPEKSFDEALRLYNRSLTADDKAWTVFNRGAAYMTRAEYKLRSKQDPTTDLKHAASDFQKSFELSADFSPPILQFAAVHATQAQWLILSGQNPISEINRSQQFLHQYEKLDPNSAQAYLIQAQIHTLTGRWNIKNRERPTSNFEQAITDIQKSIKLNPNEIAAYLQIATVYRHGAEWLIVNGHHALDWIDPGIQKTFEAEKINPDNAEVLALRSRLLKLKSKSLNDPSLNQQAAELLDLALKRNALLKSEYAN
jgi:serine/threonine protein kinase